MHFESFKTLQSVFSKGDVESFVWHRSFRGVLESVRLEDFGLLQKVGVRREEVYHEPEQLQVFANPHLPKIAGFGESPSKKKERLLISTAAVLQRMAKPEENLFLCLAFLALVNVDRDQNALPAPEEREAPHLGRIPKGTKALSSVDFHQTEGACTAPSLVLDDAVVSLHCKQTLSISVVQEGINGTLVLSKGMCLSGGDVFRDQGSFIFFIDSDDGLPAR